MPLRLHLRSARLRALSLTVPVLTLSACAVGPDYRPPQVAVPSRFEQAPAALARSAPPAELSHWWDGFGDPILARVVAQVAQQNLDLAQAAARIAQARGEERAQGAALLPHAELDASDARVKSSLLNPDTLPARGAPGFEREFTWRRLDALASWEVDLFGGARRRHEAASAELEAAVARSGALRVSLTAEAADAYLQLREAQQRRAVAERQVGVASRMVDLIDRRVREGLAAERDLHAAKAQLEAVRASIPARLAAEQAQLARLRVLMGDFTDQWRSELGAQAPLPAAPSVPARITPSELLRHRPDVVAAERGLAAANARIGAALAQYYPSVSLSALLGVSSALNGQLFVADAVEQQWGAGLRWRLFDFGRVDAEVAMARGRGAEQLAAYRAAVLRATSEVEVVLSDLVQHEAHATVLDREIAELQQARAQSAAAYEAGAISLMDVLTHDRQLLAAQDEQVHARAAAARAAVACFRAFGGGWQATPEAIVQR